MFGFHTRYLLIFAKLIDISFLIDYFIPMKKQETQQFAKFFIKDLKAKKSKFNEDKPFTGDFGYLTSN